MSKGALPLRVGLIGFGAIGQSMARIIDQYPGEATLVGALVRASKDRGSAPIPLVSSSADLMTLQPDIVVECAGHSGLEAHGAAVLTAGADLLVASLGALADEKVEAMLRKAAEAGGRKVLLPSGALGSLDALAAARLAGLDDVTYISRKSPRAWRGTPAETMIALDDLIASKIFFAGDARKAALTFPQNANVAAAVALAGIGFERTRVELMADPAATGNTHTVRAKGAFGEFEFVIAGKVLPDNPKTSMLTPYSLASALLKQRAAICFA